MGKRKRAKKAGMVAVYTFAAVGVVSLIIAVWIASWFTPLLFADPSAKALCGSLYSQQWELAKREIAKSENVDQECLFGTTTLHWAAQGGNEEVFNLLLERGADPLATGYLGLTTLHYALLGDNVEIVRTLLESGADPLAEDITGNTPLDLTVNEEIQHLLREAAK